MTEKDAILSPQARFRYAPTGTVALLPSAFGAEFVSFAAPPAPFELAAGGKVAVVSINGPLTLSDPFCESYNAILGRVQAALGSDAKCVVLKINSPGGEVFGAFDCARAMRAAAGAASKPLVAFTEAMMCSSGYALGCAASEIVAADTAMVGSIGVIRTTVDVTRQDQALGALVSLITSGARKSDGNPHVAFTDEARASMQLEVDAMASVFFEHVGLCRGSRLSAAAAQALEASSKIGAQALEAGLCDSVESWASLLARLGAEPSAAAPGASTADAILASGALVATKSKMADNEKDDKPKEDAVRAALVTASESDDPKKASRAKAALASYDSDEDDKDKDKDKAIVSAAVADDDEKKALKATVAALSASVQEMRAVQQATAQAAAQAERSAFLASRPDLTKEQLAAFEKLSFESLKAIVATLPPAREFKNPLVPSVVASVTGSNELDRDYGSSAQSAELDARMGLAQYGKGAVVTEGNVQRFGVKAPVSKI